MLTRLRVSQCLHWRAPRLLYKPRLSESRRQCLRSLGSASSQSPVLVHAASRDEHGKVVVSWTDGSARSSFSARWLWYNAPIHVDKSTGQRSLASTALAAAPRVRSVRVVDDCREVHVLWTDETTFVFPAEWLKRQAFSDESLELEHAHAAPPTLSPEPRGGRIGAAAIPTFDYSSLVASDHEVWRWLVALDEVGITLVRGAPCESRTVLRIADRICGPMQTIYGDMFDVVAEPQPINLAYATVALELHCDLVYYESPPGLQLLHCRSFDACVAGGESTFMDGFLIAEELRRRRPADFATLTRVPATFQKIHYARASPAHIVAQRPHITLDRSVLPSGAPETAGAITGVFWAPPFEGPLRVPARDIDAYYSAHVAWNSTVAELEAEGHLVEFRMEPGTVSVFNNRRMLHGRRSFSVGGTVGAGTIRDARVLQGCYVHIDEFKSRLLTLCSRFGGLDRICRVGNQQAR